MRAALLREPRVFDLVHRDAPRPGPGEVIVRVTSVSICGSDLNAFRGVNPRNVLPTVLGHEFAGDVVEVGPDTSKRLLNRAVCVEPNICCGICRYCTQGLPNICPKYRVLGEALDLPGAFAELICVPERQLFELPSAVPAELGSIVQPLAICYEGVVHRAKVRAGERVLVVGAGPIGLGCLLLARNAGAEVMIVDVVPDRLLLAGELGAERVVDAREDVQAAVRAWTGGYGVDVSFEAVGGEQTSSALTAQSATAPRGRIVVLGAFSNKTFPFPVGDLKNKEQELLGSHGHPQAFAEVIRLMSTGSVDASPLVSHRMRLTDVQEAFRLLDERVDGVMKVVMQP